MNYTLINYVSDIDLSFYPEDDIFVLNIGKRRYIKIFYNIIMSIAKFFIKNNYLKLFYIMLKITQKLPEISIPLYKKEAGKKYEYSLKELPDLIHKLLVLKKMGYRVNLEYIIPSLIEDVLMELDNNLFA